MAWWAFVPGVLLTALGYSVFPPVRRLGTTLLALGVGLAVLRGLAPRLGLPLAVATWALVGLGVGMALWWAAGYVGLRRRIRTVAGRIEPLGGGTGAPGELADSMQRHLGAMAALRRMLDPRIDRAFRRGQMAAVDALPGPRRTARRPQSAT